MQNINKKNFVSNSLIQNVILNTKFQNLMTNQLSPILTLRRTASELSISRLIRATFESLAPELHSG